jgi:isoquinoline 1-oxidoreductase beta subunit
MLVNAAARRWQVPAGEITVRDGVVSHAPVEAARRVSANCRGRRPQEAVPASVVLKEAKDFRLIGKQAPRKDSVDKTNGQAQFTQDIQLPGMLVAVVAHPPRFGATVRGFDASAAKARQGCRRCGADSFRRRGAGQRYLEREKRARCAAGRLGRKPLVQARQRGNPGALSRNGKIARPGRPSGRRYRQAFAGAARIVRATYDFPYLAHAAMEPMNCVIRLSRTAARSGTANRCTPATSRAWRRLRPQAGTGADQHALCRRQLRPPREYAFRLCRRSGTDRQGDRRQGAGQAGLDARGRHAGGYYRPLFHHALEAALDAGGQLTGWRHRLVGQSILLGSPFESMMVKDGIDAVSVEGAANLPYAIPNLLVDLHTPKDIDVPVLWWRSVGSSHTAYSTEVFLDQVARAAGKDPVAWRLELLADHPRHRGVLRLAAEKSGWGTRLPAGVKGTRRGRGVAVHESFHSYVAQVAEVTVAADGTVKVDRVVCAVDCGIAINPDNIRSQIEGAVGFALSAALHGEITLKEGAVVEGNFDTYRPIRIGEMPRLEVHIVPSTAKPTGVGEPGVPPLAPAVANAIGAATGKYPDRLPFRAEDLRA